MGLLEINISFNREIKKKYFGIFYRNLYLNRKNIALKIKLVIRYLKNLNVLIKIYRIEKSFQIRIISNGLIYRTVISFIYSLYRNAGSFWIY